jgi:hypothetical protein
MPADRPIDLKQTISLFESMLECYMRARERLMERRRGAIDHVMVEIDDLLAVNSRTTACIQSALEGLREQIKF